MPLDLIKSHLIGCNHVLSCITLLTFHTKSLTHWGRGTHICVGKLTTIGSDNGLSPGRHQAIIWTNAGILLIRPVGTYFSEILIEIQKFSFKKIDLKMSSGKWWPSRLGRNMLTFHTKSLIAHESIPSVFANTSIVSLSMQLSTIQYVLKFYDARIRYKTRSVYRHHQKL